MGNEIYYLFTFISGTFFGSFLNVVSDRIINGDNIFIGRSKCDFCKKPLKAKNLVPLFSFIFQRGKCADCAKKLSFYYPVSEIMTGLLFALAAYLSKVFVDFTAYRITGFIFLIFVFSIYVILFLTDAKYRLIPNIIIFIGSVGVISFVFFSTVYELLKLYNLWSNDPFGKYLLKSGLFMDRVVYSGQQFLYSILSALALALFFYLLNKITKGKGMGEGDITLAFLIGVVNHFPINILAIFLGFIFGAVVSLGLIVLRIKTIKDTVPFGPFLIAGSVVSLVFGRQILNWYLGLF